MIGGGISLFGFDLFGRDQRKAAKPNQNCDRKKAELSPEEEEAERRISEAFLWGMYPVY